MINPIPHCWRLSENYVIQLRKVGISIFESKERLCAHICAHMSLKKVRPHQYKQKDMNSKYKADRGRKFARSCKNICSLLYLLPVSSYSLLYCPYASLKPEHVHFAKTFSFFFLYIFILFYVAQLTLSLTHSD